MEQTGNATRAKIRIDDSRGVPAISIGADTKTKSPTVAGAFDITSESAAALARSETPGKADPSPEANEQIGREFGFGGADIPRLSESGADDLPEVIHIWPRLSHNQRRTILLMLRAFSAAAQSTDVKPAS